MVKDFQQSNGTFNFLYKIGLGFPMSFIDFRLNYKGDLSTTPTLVTGDGDGTVNARSLKSCEQWVNTKAQREKSIHSVELPGADHMGILSDKRVIQYVLKILTDSVHYNAEESEKYDYHFLSTNELI